MSQTPRTSTPLSSSPGRPSSFSRPNGPWSPRSRLRQNHRSSQSTASVGSLNAIQASSTSPAPSPSSWLSSSTPRPYLGHTSTSYGSADEATVQWQSAGLDWTVKNIHRLRDFVEGSEVADTSGTGDRASTNGEEFEVLSQAPILGDRKYKIEIERSPLQQAQSNEDNEARVQTLTLYLTLMLDFHSEYELPVTIMVAIKCQGDRQGERGARPEWVWEYWQHGFVYGSGNEVWSCALPSLSSLLENQRIRETDSMVISVQVHSPLGPFLYTQPDACYIPREILDGLEASLDNPNTGDVKFVCLERLPLDAEMPSASASDLPSPTFHRSPSSTSSQSPFSGQMTARKRVIYAHSDILSRRSDYFATMLASSFSENPNLVPGERKLHTIVVEEADFVTIYWLLKHCYANWLLFKEADDPRAAVEGIGIDWSARWLRAGGGEWDWKSFRRVGSSASGDARSIASADSFVSDQSRSVSQSSQNGSPGARNTTSTARPTAPPQRQGAPTVNARQTSGTRRPAPGSPSGIPQSSSTPSRPKSLSTAGTLSSTSPYSITSRQHRAAVLPTPDPHPHPTPAPAPASALSMYQVAHRYEMPALSNLALEHIMSTITPQSSFAFLLATSMFDELKTLIEDYVVEKWEEVSVCEEFEQCCDEVAAGEWGAEGGKTMMALFRRLRSPNNLATFARA